MVRLIAGYANEPSIIKKQGRPLAAGHETLRT